MYDKLLQTVTNLGSPKVLIVGDFMLDIYIYGDAVKISPEAPVPILKIAKTTYCCGGAGSVAADLSALGATAHCLGVVGVDQGGEILRKKLAEAGADVTDLLRIATHSTISKQRLIGLAQHLHRQQLIRVDQESTESLCEEVNETILQAYKHKLPQIDVVSLQDHNKGLLNSPLCSQMIQLAKVMKTFSVCKHFRKA